jgi:CheY-like chemotaxis protein
MTRVLIIDDDEINNFTLEAILERNAHVDSFEIQDGGISALEYLEQAEVSNDFPDLIFVDINMPEMDGYGFLDQYQSRYLGKHDSTRIYMLSSSVSELDKDRSLAYDFVSEYISKPLSRTKLEELISTT